jgi:sugar-specific transcriptional regulator TrmB
VNTNQQLQKVLHLGNYEVRVYMAALQFEAASLSELAESADIPRTAAYPPVKALLARGMLSEIKVKKRVKYQAVPPESLLAIHDRERLSLAVTTKQLTHTIRMPTQGMSVRYFPGMHGLNQSADIFLEHSKTKLWKTIEHADFMVTKTGESRFDKYIEDRVKKGITARVIIPAHPASPWLKKRMERTNAELTEIVQVSPDVYPIDSSIAICGNMVVMHNAHGVPSSTLIENAEIARTLESMHDMIWDRYKR